MTAAFKCILHTQQCSFFITCILSRYRLQNNWVLGGSNTKRAHQQICNVLNVVEGGL